MDVTPISAELKEKTKEFRSLEKTYKAALGRVNKEHEKAKIVAPAQINSQIESIKREIARDKDRLSELKSAGLSKNKDGSISQRSNAGKEAVRLQDKIPQLKKRLSNKHDEAASILTKLNQETQEKHESLKSEFETNSTVLSGSIKSLLDNYHQTHISDKSNIAKKVVEDLKNGESFSKFKSCIEGIQAKEPVTIKEASSKEIAENYIKGAKFENYTIAHLDRHKFLDVVFSNQYSSLITARHFIRWGLFYVFWAITLWVFFKYGDQAKAEIEGVLMILCIILWPITFIWSFFYKKSKYKIHKTASKDLTEIKTALDRDIDALLGAFWKQSFKKDLGDDLSDLVTEFYKEKNVA